MGIISFAEMVIAWRTNSYRKGLSGPLGDYWRQGGDVLTTAGLPVTSSSVVIDAGGYRGAWTDEMLCLYSPKVIVVEAHPGFSARLEERYRENDRVRVVRGALGGRNGEIDIFDLADGTSAVRKRGKPIRVQKVPIGSILNELDDVACMKINIEGGEYEVLDELIGSGAIRKLGSLIVQFHDFFPDASSKRAVICAGLEKTHRRAFDFPFVWERWDRVDNAKWA